MKTSKEVIEVISGLLAEDALQHGYQVFVAKNLNNELKEIVIKPAINEQEQWNRRKKDENK